MRLGHENNVLAAEVIKKQAVKNCAAQNVIKVDVGGEAVIDFVYEGIDFISRLLNAVSQSRGGFGAAALIRKGIFFKQDRELNTIYCPLFRKSPMLIKSLISRLAYLPHRLL